jgi:hypothetical protein
MCDLFRMAAEYGREVIDDMRVDEACFLLKTRRAFSGDWMT